MNSKRVLFRRALLCALVQVFFFSGQAQEQTGWLQVPSVLSEISLRSWLFGRSAEDAVSSLTAKIHEEAGFRVECQSGILTGISPQNCLIGVRKIAEMLGSGLPKNPQHLGITKLVIDGRDTWKSHRRQWWELVVVVPYNGYRDDMRRFIDFQLNNPRQAHDRQVVESLFRQAKEGPNALPYDIRPAHNLSLSDLSRGVTLLQNIQESIKLPEGVLDMVIIGRSNKPIFESHRQLKMKINARQTLEEGQIFVAEQARFLANRPAPELNPDELNRWHEIQQFYVQRDELNKRISNLKSRGAQVLCGPNDEIPVVDCLEGVRRFETAVQMAPGFDLRMLKGVIIHPSDVGPYLREGEDHQTSIHMYFESSPADISEQLRALQKGWRQQ